MTNNPKEKAGSKALRFFISRKILTTFFITIVFLAISFLIPLLYKNKIANYTYMELCYYISQIMSALFVVLGVVIALLQYVASTYESQALREREMELHEKEIIDLEKDRVQKAIDLSEYYKDNILDNIFIIDSIYKNMKITDILDKIKISEMKEFDQYELNELLKPEEIEKIAKLMNNENFIPTLILNSQIYGFAEQGFQVVDVINDNGEIEKRIKCNESILIREYSNILNSTLNNAEYFAMNFMHNTADETVVYQSLHKTYLKFMRTVYYDISINNIKGEEKLYTNAIELFNLWKMREEEDKKRVVEHSRERVHHGTTVREISEK